MSSGRPWTRPLRPSSPSCPVSSSSFAFGSMRTAALLVEASCLQRVQRMQSTGCHLEKVRNGQRPVCRCATLSFCPVQQHNGCFLDRIVMLDRGLLCIQRAAQAAHRARAGAFRAEAAENWSGPRPRARRRRIRSPAPERAKTASARRTAQVRAYPQYKPCQDLLHDHSYASIIPQASTGSCIIIAFLSLFRLTTCPYTHAGHSIPIMVYLSSGVCLDRMQS